LNPEIAISGGPLGRPFLCAQTDTQLVSTMTEQIFSVTYNGQDYTLFPFNQYIETMSNGHWVISAAKEVGNVPGL